MATSNGASTLTQAIGEILRAEAGRLGLSGNKIAQQTGLPQTRVSLTLGGKKTPKVDDLAMICAAIGIDMRTVLAEALKRADGSELPDVIPSRYREA